MLLTPVTVQKIQVTAVRHFGTTEVPRYYRSTAVLF